MKPQDRTHAITSGHRDGIVHVQAIGGQCPVQAFGTVVWEGGPTPPRCWYFRARWAAWHVAVGDASRDDPQYVDDDGADLFVRGWWGKGMEAGWMPEAEAVRLICEVLRGWIALQRGEGGSDA